jgi:hypothetical protein
LLSDGPGAVHVELDRHELLLDRLGDLRLAQDGFFKVFAGIAPRGPEVQQHQLSGLGRFAFGGFQITSPTQPLALGRRGRQADEQRESEFPWAPHGCSFLRQECLRTSGDGMTPAASAVLSERSASAIC